MHATLSRDQVLADTQRLDDLVAVFERDGPEKFGLLLEHLKSARAYLVGGMPNEYTAGLEMAREAAASLSEPELRRLCLEILDHLREDVTRSDLMWRTEAPHSVHRRVHHHPAGAPAPGTGSRLWNFFGSPPISLGTFYPKSHITVVLPSQEAAQGAHKALRDAGFEECETIAASATEMLEFFHELKAHSGVWGELMTRLSRTIGTEQLFVDFAVRLAREEAGFLLVYNPEEAEAPRIREIIVPFRPISMQRYLAGAVEGMINTPKTSGPEL